MEPLVPRGSGNEFDGSDFSNNLFSDLAPLLTLFGEQVTKQFLSQSMGYGDDILLAMVPLGIITCIVSAIRVGGRRWLKALVGRARESRAAAEMEIMSSTSDAVCELWSGVEIVRERGTPRTKEFIYQPVTDKANMADLLNAKIIYDLRTACEEQVLTATKSSPTNLRQWYRQWFTRGWETDHKSDTGASYPNVGDIQLATRLMQQAPNLTLNVTMAMSSPRVTWAFAFLGIVLQLGVFTIATMVTYHWQLGGGSSRNVVEYGFPLFITGSSLLCSGIFLCSYIIEAVTEEIDFVQVKQDKHTRVIRIQGACTVGDQRFGSYAIKNEEGNATIRTSRINGNPDLSLLSVIATCLSLSGYIMQFVGLRAMHWSVAITVLGATLIMAGVRAYVRRSIAANPEVIQLEEGAELSWLVFEALGLESFELGIPVSGDLAPEEATSNLAKYPDGPAGTVPSPALPPSPKLAASILAQKAVEVRQELTDLVNWQDEHAVLAHQLAEAITGTLEFVLGHDAFEADPTGTSIKIGGVDTSEWPRKNAEEVLHATTPFAAILDYILADARRVIEEDIPEEAAARLRDWLSQDIPSLKRDGMNAEYQTPPSPSGPSGQDNSPTMDERLHEENPTAYPKNALGFTMDVTGLTDAELSFAWEADVRVASPHIGGSQTVKFGFCAQSVIQEPNRPNAAAASIGQGMEPPAWTTDPRPLAAFLSLCALTVGRQSRRFPGFFRFRVLGCGWDVPVPAHLVDPPLVVEAKVVKEWLEEGLGDSPRASPEAQDIISQGLDNGTDNSVLPVDNKDFQVLEGQDTATGNSSSAADIRGTDTLSFIKQRIEAQNGPGDFRMVDFYKTWIERETPSNTLANFSNLIERLSGPPSLDGTPMPPSHRYMFGLPFAFHSRRLRHEALQTRYKQADPTDQVPNTPSPPLENPPQDSAASASSGIHRLSGKSLHQTSPPNGVSRLLSYMFPDETIFDDEAARKSLHEYRRVRTHQTSISRLCAQEIFISFLLQLVAFIKSIKGGARDRKAVRGDPKNTLRWHHPALSQLADIVCKSKLANNAEEAFILIIPAFHAYGLLPTRMDNERGGTYNPTYSYYDDYVTISGRSESPVSSS